MEPTPPPAPTWESRHSAAAILSLLLCVSPLLLLTLEWGVAWLQLGHRPRFQLDDPKSISLLPDVLHLLTGISLLSLAITPILVPLLRWKWTGSHPHARLIALGGFLLPLSCLFILRQAPFGITTWHFD